MNTEVIQVHAQSHSRCERMTSKLANDTKEEVCRTARPHETQRMYLHVQTEVTGREQQGWPGDVPRPRAAGLGVRREWDYH